MSADPTPIAEPDIRPQVATDLTLIETINDAAFAGHGGTAAFDDFRRERDDIISLVAWIGSEPVGHVLFSPVVMDTAAGPIQGMGLGQLAVAPAWQKRGIGKKLAETGIDQLRASRCPFIIVVGHASYYPRFGFEPGHRHGVVCQWDGVPAETFMVLYLDKAQQGELRGKASFDGL